MATSPGQPAARRTRPKRALAAIFFLLGIAVVFYFAKPSVKGPPGVLWFTFNRDAIGVMNAAGFRVVAATSTSPEEISVPLDMRLRAKLPFHQKTVSLPDDELEPTTLRIVVQRPGRGEVRCLARYHEGYLAIVVLRYQPGLQAEAAAVREVLRRAYPRERIKLEEDPKR
ncbi:MAG: hypothetical protein U1G07_11370 [Verrucomicrobiota bacterium]